MAVCADPHDVVHQQLADAGHFHVAVAEAEVIVLPQTHTAEAVLASAETEVAEAREEVDARCPPLTHRNL